jgi:hypothetical protein
MTTTTGARTVPLFFVSVFAFGVDAAFGDGFFTVMEPSVAKNGGQRKSTVFFGTASLKPDS